jgi:perosamine synthetase
MATTHRQDLYERMRVMSLHGISKDAWKRFSSEGGWYYEIVAPGFKYNLTDLASAIGIHQLKKAEMMRKKRERVAGMYREGLRDLSTVSLPPDPPDRVHSWHLFYIRLNLETLSIDRARFIEELKKKGIITSVHWMPLHMHPYYRETYGHRPEDYPQASAVYSRLVSLPIFPDMRDDEIEYVMDSVRSVSEQFRAG